MENKEQSSEASDDEMFVEVQSGEISSDSTIPDYSSTSFPANDDTEVEEITNAQSEISSVAPVPETNCAIVISDSTSATTLYDIDDIPNVSSSENDRTLSDIETHNTGVSESVTACSRHEEGRTTLTQNESIRLHRDDKKSLPVHSEPVAVEVKATDGQAENMSRTAVFAESNFVTAVISSSTSVSSVCDSDEVHSLSGSVPDYTLTDPETSNVEPDDDAAVCCRNDKHSVTLLPHRTPTSCIAVRMRSGRMYFTCVSQANSVNVRKLRKSSALKCPIPHVVLTRIDTVPVSLRRVRNSPTVQKEGTKCSAPSSTATTHGLPEAMVFSPITSNATSLLPSPEESCHLSEDYVTVNAPCTATPIKEKHSVTDGGLSIEDAHSVVDNLLLTDNSVSAAMNEPGNLSTNCNTGSDRLTAGEPTSNKNMFNFVESEAAESSDKVSEIAAVDESSCHSVGSKRPHVDDLAEGSHPKQQKMEDSNSPFSRVTPVCHDMSQPSAEQPMNTEVLAPGVVIDIDVVEKTHTDKCQPVTCLPTDTNFMETEGGTLAGQTEISSMNDAIAVNENALVRDSSVFTTPSASNIVTNIEAGEETHATKSQRGSYVVAAKNDMMAEQLVVDALSSANDAIADNDNLLAPDSSAFTAAAEPSVDTNIEAVEDSDVSKSQQEFTTLPIDLNFVTTEDDMMAEQLFVDVKSSVNDVIADNDNLLAPDSSALTAATEPSIFTNIEVIEEADITESEQEVTIVPTDSYFVTTEDAMMTEQLFVDVISSVNDDSDNSLVSGRSSCTAAAAATEPSVVTNIEVIEETVIAKSHQEVVTVPIDLNFVTTEDVVMTEQLFVDVESSVNDATAHDDSLLASDSSAFTAATEPTIVIEETDITESQREVTTVPTGSYFVTTEDVVTEELFVDVESTVNDAIADNENPLAPDSSALTATAATEPNVVTNIKVIEETDITEPQQEVTTVPTGSYFVTTEDVVTEELFVDVESSVNDSIADAIADAIADNDNRLAPENSVFTAVNKIETFNKNSESQHEQKVASVNLESIPVSTPGDSGTADDEVHMCVTVSDTQHVIVTSTSTAAGVSDVFVLPVGEELDVDAVKNSEVLNVSVVAGKSPGIPGTSRALILPPPPSVTNAGSKMRMRIEAANKEKLPASATVKKCQKNRSVTVDPNETLASSLVAEQAPQISTVHKRTRAGRGSRWSNSDIEVSIPPTDSGLSCGDESSELVEEESKSQEQSQPTDKKESVSVVDWRPPPTKSAALDITVEGGVVSDEKSSSELCDKVSDCQKQSELAAEEQKIASLLDWRPPPSRTSAQHPTAPSEVKSLLEWKPTPGWRPKSTPVEIGQVSESNVEPSVSPVRSQSANIPFCPPQNATHDQDLRNPMLDGQRPLPNVAHPVPGQMPVVIMSQPSLSAPPCNVQLPGASLAPHIVPPNAAQPVVPSSVVAGQTSCGQQVMMTVQPPPQIGLAPAPTVPPPLPVQPATVPPPMVVTGAGHSGQPPVPGVVLPPVSSVQAQTPPRVMPVNHQPPPASFSQPPAGLLPFPAPNVSPQSQVGPNCGQPLPPGIVQPAMPQPVRPVQGPPPADVRFGQNHPPHPHPGLLPHPRMAPHPVPPPQTVPHVRYPPQQFIPPRGPPAHVMASGPRQPPPQWGPVPPPHAAPPMWGPPRHGIPPAHFNQPHPDVRNPAVLHEWHPPHVNPPGAPYMQPGLPGPNWRPPMDCRPPDQGWWAPPAGVPQWGPPHGPPDWSYGAAAEPSTTGSEPSVPNYTAETAGCDNETASLAQAAREWADWQQRYAEWYYTYYGYSAAPVPSASSTTCNTVVTTVSVTSSASFTEKNASKNSFSAIPLPAKEAVAKSGTADAFAKFAEKAASDVNYTLGISSNKPSQNIASVSVSSSTNVSSTSVKPSQDLPAKSEKTAGANMWVVNLPTGTKAVDICALVSQFGKVVNCKVGMMKSQKDATGLVALVAMEKPDDVSVCITKLNQTLYRGNKISVMKVKAS